MDQDLIKAYGMISAHEFAMEMMMASWLAQMPKQQADNFLAAIREQAQQASSKFEADDAQEQTRQVFQEAAQITDNLIQKVRTRADNLRDQIN
jgi:TorA maturation chaperone TorD